MTELVVEVFRRSGYSPEISYTSWSLAEERAASGTTIGVFPLVNSEARRTNLLASDALIDFEYVLFYDRQYGEPKVSSAADLDAMRVGSVAGYDYWEELESTVTEFVEFNSTLDGFRALDEGRIDVLAEGLLSGRAVLADPDFAGDAGDFGYLNDSPLVHSVEGLHFMMPDTEEAAAVMKQFNEALAELRHSNEYKRIVSELEPSAFCEVTLTLGETGLVELLDESNNVVLLAPQGTRAQVLAWPEEFLGSAHAPAKQLLVKVKILNGPAQGRVLYVDAAMLVIDPDAS